MNNFRLPPEMCRNYSHIWPSWQSCLADLQGQTDTDYQESVRSTTIPWFVQLTNTTPTHQAACISWHRSDKANDGMLSSLDILSRELRNATTSQTELDSGRCSTALTQHAKKGFRERMTCLLIGGDTVATRAWLQQPVSQLDNGWRWMAFQVVGDRQSFRALLFVRMVLPWLSYWIVATGYCVHSSYSKRSEIRAWLGYYWNTTSQPSMRLYNWCCLKATRSFK